MTTRIFRYTTLCAITIMSFLPLHADVTLTGNAASRDAVWKKESWSQDSWMIHTSETLYKITTAKMGWTFPGATGSYTLKLKVFAKANGQAPIWVTVNGTKVWEGKTPLPFGRTSIYCCGSQINKCPDGTGYIGEPAWIDTKKSITIPNGALVQFWGTTVYPCMGSSWTSGTTRMGYGGGSYAGFYEILLGGGSAVATPSIKLASQNLSFNAQEGAPNPSPMNMSIINGGTGTLPALTASSNASWLTVQASGSGNTQNISNTVDLSGRGPGTHTATVTVSGSNVTTVTYTVTLTVVSMPPVTVVSPNGGEIFMIGDTVSIQWTSNPAQVNDVDIVLQLDNGLTTLFINTTSSISNTSSQWGNFVWIIPSEIEGVSLVNNDCKISIGQYPTHTPSDMSDGSFSILDPASIHLRFNAGGNTAGEWQTLGNYVDGGKNYSFSGSVTTVDETPAEVYLTVRHLEPTFNFSFVPNGEYSVRMHFADPYGVANDRKMNISIGNDLVLSNYCIVTAAGGGKKADIQEFDVSVSDGNGLSIELKKGTGTDAFVNAIEIIGAGSSPVTTMNKAFNEQALAASLAQKTLSGRVVVSLKNSGPQKITLYAVGGRSLSTRDVQGPGQFIIDTGVASGLLIMEIRDRTGASRIFKLTKSKSAL